MEFAALHFAFNGVEMSGYSVDAGRIAYEYYFVGELLGLQVKVEARAVGIDDKFRFRKMFHNGIYDF